MSSPSDELATWNSLEPLRMSGDEVSQDAWAGPVFEYGCGEYPYVKVYACRRTCVKGVPDEQKHYALEAAFEGHVEFKHAVGNVSCEAFQEMEKYIGGQKDPQAITIFASGH